MSSPDSQSLGTVGKAIITAEQIAAKVAELGAAITNDYKDSSPLLVCVLKGAFVFMADLVREIDLPLEVDFMAVSSYGTATKTSGVVRIVKDLDIDISGRDVILVEDIVDSGLTLRWLCKNLQSRRPASLTVCALFVKEGLQREEPELGYVGFQLPPDFVVGYGLDVAERFRQLKGLHEFQES